MVTSKHGRNKEKKHSLSNWFVSILCLIPFLVCLCFPPWCGRLLSSNCLLKAPVVLITSQLFIRAYLIYHRVSGRLHPRQSVSPSQGQHNHDQQPRTLTLAVYNILLGQGIVHSCFFTHVIHNKRLSINSTFSQMDIRQNCTCGSADMMQKISCRNCSILLTALCGWQTRLPFYLYWWLLLHWCQYHVYNETPAIKQYTDKQERVQIKYHSAQYVHSIGHYMHSLLVGWLERLSTKSSTTHF